MPHRPRALSCLAVVAIAVVGLTAAASAAPVGAPSVAPPPANPTSASQIQNLDRVRTAILAYYGDVTTTTPDPVQGTTMLHDFAPTGAYATEVGTVVDSVEQYLTDWAAAHPANRNKSVVFDIDDTLLTTYNYRYYANFSANPSTFAAFVNSASFPATPRMVELHHYARTLGYRTFFVTERPQSQFPGTVTDLADVGYDAVPVSWYVFKDYTNDTWLAPCAPNCTPTQYRTLTRQYLKSQGNLVVANIGDQPSDLAGGGANKTFAIPNPMYYVP